MKQLYDFRIVSLNVRGINNKVKRLSIFDWARKKNFDVIMLQECYCSEDDMTAWSDEWGGTCIFAHGSKHSKGTMMMFKPGFDIEILEELIDKEGRYIIARVLIQGEPFNLINVYAPNTMRDKHIFFLHLKEEIESHDIDDGNLIIGGDWNTIQDGKLDKKGGKELHCETVTKSMTELLDQLDLTDVWRLRNPKSSRFTFRQKTPLIQSRLDFFMISNILQDTVVEAEIIPSVWSDHSAVVLGIKHLPDYERGSSHWKFNASLCEDKDYVNSLCHNIRQWCTEYEDMGDDRIVWELIKYQIRKFTMSYCSQKKLNKKRHSNALQNELVTLEEELSLNHCVNKMLRLSYVKTEIKKIESEKMEGLIIRSKIKWVEEGEKSTTFFFGLEKNNYIKKHIRKLKIEDQVTITDEHRINTELKTFYHTLYTSKTKSNIEDQNEFFASNSIPTLTNHEKELCNVPLTKEDYSNTLKTFKKGKSPGNDGLTFEFYEKFWCFISDPLVKCYERAFIEGELSTSQKQAIITLLEKNGKDRLFLKNWRPISLINFDYKILSKTLSLRVQKVLPVLIHSNQSGFVEGRYIGDSIRIIQDAMAYTKNKNLQGILLFIDFEKAFDSIEWKYLWKVLERFNFGEDLIKWIKILYNNVSSSIMNNGKTSGYFKLERGVRQGDPLSPYLFILAIELLAINIREDKDIKGFKIKNIEQKLSMYADDMTISVDNINSAKKVFRIFKAFAKISGLHMNLEKTEGMWLGSQQGSKDQPLGILWPTNPIKSLGIYHSYNTVATMKGNFEDKIDKLKKQLHWWKARNLSFTGKVLIIKALGISKFALVASLINVPENIINEINSIIFNFVWNGKTDKVKRKQFIQTIDMGGLKMVDFDNYVKAAKCKWIQRYLNNQNDAWKDAFEFFCAKENLSVYLRSNFALNELPKNIPNYYLDSISTWHLLRKNVDILREKREDFLWYNKNYLINNRTVYNNRLFKAGIWSEQDLYTNDVLIPFHIWIKRGVHQADFLIWRGIVSATRKRKLDLTGKKVQINMGFVNINGLDKVIDSLSQKEMLNAINLAMFRTLKQTDFKAKSKFIGIYGNISDMEWKGIYVLARSLNVKNSMKDLQYKILYRFVATNRLLFKMGKVASTVCTFCELEQETIEHLFYECLKIKEFWISVFEIWNFVTNSDVHPTSRDILLGRCFEKTEIGEMLNTLIIIGKFFIWTCKQNLNVTNVKLFQDFVKQTFASCNKGNIQGAIRSFCEL